MVTVWPVETFLVEIGNVAVVAPFVSLTVTLDGTVTT
jgi:hypothetical protein